MSRLAAAAEAQLVVGGPAERIEEPADVAVAEHRGHVLVDLAPGERLGEVADLGRGPGTSSAAAAAAITCREGQRQNERRLLRLAHRS